MVLVALYPGSSTEKTGREPGRFDHVLCDVVCMVLCVFLIIELLPTQSDSKYCPPIVSLLLEFWMLLGTYRSAFYELYCI